MNLVKSTEDYDGTYHNQEWQSASEQAQQEVYDFFLIAH